MKLVANVFLSLICITLIFASQVSASLYKAQVVEVLNNCTIKVLTDEGIEVVRLAEVVCPSTRFTSLPCTEQAKEFLMKITSGKEVILEFWTKDTLGRSVCEVFLPDGSSLAKLLVSEGYALQDRLYSSSPELSFLESDARKNKQGVWAHVAKLLRPQI